MFLRPQLAQKSSEIINHCHYCLRKLLKEEYLWIATNDVENPPSTELYFREENLNKYWTWFVWRRCANMTSRKGCKLDELKRTFEDLTLAKEQGQEFLKERKGQKEIRKAQGNITAGQEELKQRIYNKKLWKKTSEKVKKTLRKHKKRWNRA